MLKRRHQNSRKGDDAIRLPAHLKYVRGFRCAVDNGMCAGRIEAAHVEGSGTGGMGKKADDVFTIPLCSHHHAERHRIGWRTFDRVHNLDALDIAKDIARRSPAVQRAAMAAGYNAGGDIEPNP